MPPAHIVSVRQMRFSSSRPTVITGSFNSRTWALLFDGEGVLFSTRKTEPVVFEQYQRFQLIRRLHQNIDVVADEGVMQLREGALHKFFVVEFDNRPQRRPLFSKQSLGAASSTINLATCMRPRALGPVEHSSSKLKAS